MEKQCKRCGEKFKSNRNPESMAFAKQTFCSRKCALKRTKSRKTMIEGVKEYPTYFPSHNKYL